MKGSIRVMVIALMFDVIISVLAKIDEHAINNLLLNLVEAHLPLHNRSNR